MTGSVLVDTNLLLFLIIGRATPDWIERHKRFPDRSPYSRSSLIRLVELLDTFEAMLVTPNTLTEAGTLFHQGVREPALSKLRVQFRTLLSELPETHFESRTVANRTDFDRLGLTDSILLELCSTGADTDALTLLTVDGPLARRASELELSMIDFRDIALAS